MDNKRHAGLTQREVEESRLRYGTNKITKTKGKSFFSSFIENLGDPVIKVLIISLIVNIIFTFKNIDWFETGGIAIAILLATTISTFSEYSSGEAFKRICESVQIHANVLREGKIVSVPTDEVVVGDVVILCAGEKICADGILISGEIGLDQSAMTGESREVAKSPFTKPLPDPDKSGDLLSPDSSCSCPRGCLVSRGEGKMVVMRVGNATHLGGIVRELQTQTRESPLKIRLSKLARQISFLGYGAAVLIALLSLFSAFFIECDFSRELIMQKLSDPNTVIGELLHSITLGITVVIMAVPEGLPMMIAVVLSSNVSRMLRDMVLVRKPTGIEAAGSMNILFTDKTGTLTEGKMSISGFILPDGSRVSSVAELKKSHADIFSSFCRNSLSNTGAHLSGKRVIGNNSTEIALLNAVKRYAGYVQKDSIEEKLPFDSKYKYSASRADGKRFLKGAPELLISSALPDFDKAAVEYEISRAQETGGRVIAMCECKDDGKPLDPSSAYRSSRFICAVILSDKLRRSAKASVEALRDAGIDVVMITGDSPLTARAIASDAGMITQRRNLCLTHSDIEKITDGELRATLPRLAVLARALPSDKSRLVRLSQEDELVVGMTGDGINDAPALRASDVGFAMGSGSEVAKEAGDVVILDNDLASIVRAVLYGRNIFKSIRKFLVFQLTMNFSSALVCMIAPLLGFDTPITVSQMLWVNMIMDTLGGLAFAGEAPARRILREKPKKRDTPILNKYMIHQILISGSFSVLISMLFWSLPIFTSHFRPHGENRVLLSAFFALFIFLGVMQCINSRTDRLNPFAGITKNKTFVLIMCIISAIQISFVYLGGDVLRAYPLLPSELLFTLACASLALPFELLRKIVWRFSGHSEGF